MGKLTLVLILVLSAGSVLTGLLFGPGHSALAGDPVAIGKEAFEKSACQLCHPGGGRGAGPSLIGIDQEKLSKIVRSGKGGMPPYSTAKLSDENLAAIHAYLQSLSPKTTPPASTPTPTATPTPAATPTPVATPTPIAAAPTPEATPPAPTPPAPIPNIGTAPPAATTQPAPVAAPEPAPGPPPAPAQSTLKLLAPQQGRVGRAVDLIAVLKDPQGNPVPDAIVYFMAKKDFFIQDYASLGQAKTDALGAATLRYIPRNGKELEVLAKSNGEAAAAATAIVPLEPGRAVYYQPHVGIRLPALGTEVFIGPVSARIAAAAAPTSAFRLPGAMFSWLLLFVGLVATLWVTFMLVMYQVYRISRE